MDGSLAVDRMNTLMPSTSGWIKAEGPDLPLIVELVGFFQGKDVSLGSLASQLAMINQKAFHMAAKFDVDMCRGRFQVPELSIAGLGVALTGDITARNLGSDKALIKGRVSLAQFNLRSLMKKLNQPIVNGELAIKNFTDPELGFDLALDKINGDRYLPEPQNKGKKAKNPGKAISATPETMAAATAIYRINVIMI